MTINISRYDPVDRGHDGRSPAMGEVVHSPVGDYVKWDDVRGIIQMAEESAECLERIRNGSPSACELESCNHLPTAVQQLIDFAWRTVNQTGNSK